MVTTDMGVTTTRGITDMGSTTVHITHTPHTGDTTVHTTDTPDTGDTDEAPGALLPHVETGAKVTWLDRNMRPDNTV